jgi:preprotein translocase subunit Sss1
VIILERKTEEEVILSALNHKERRDIIRILAESSEGVKYSNILEELGLTTSKLNYQLKELDGFFDKDEDGAYLLSERGKKAQHLLNQFDKDLLYHEEISEKSKKPISTNYQKILTIFLIGILLGGSIGYLFTPKVNENAYINEISAFEEQINDNAKELDQLIEELINLEFEVESAYTLIDELERIIEEIDRENVRLTDQIQQLAKYSTNQKHGITYLSTHWHYEANYLSDEEIHRDFTLFQSQGISNITLVAIWKHIEPTQGEYNIEALDDLVRVCTIAEEYGLGVIIDFHTLMQEDSFTMPEWIHPKKFETVIDDENARESWLNYLDFCVEYLNDEPVVTSWHMMNEPARLEWGCNCTIDEFISLWSDMRAIFKSHSSKPVSIRFGGDTFDTHFNRDKRIYDICDYISFNVYQSTNRDLLNDIVSQVYGNNSFVMISEYGLETNDDLDQFYSFENYVEYFQELGVDYCVAWYWRADYDKGAPDAPGTGFNLANAVDGSPRPAFRSLGRYIPIPHVFNEVKMTSFKIQNPNDTLKVTADKVSWSHADRSVFFGMSNMENESQIGDFTHRLSFSFTEVEAGDDNQRGIGGIWKVSNEFQIPALNSISVWGEQVGDKDDVYYLYFAQKENDSLVFIRNLGIFSAGNKLDLEVSREGNHCRLKVFVDDYRVLVSDTGIIYGLNVPYIYTGLAGHPMRTEDVNDWTSGYIENFMISHK